MAALAGITNLGQNHSDGSTSTVGSDPAAVKQRGRGRPSRAVKRARTAAARAARAARHTGTPPDDVPKRDVPFQTVTRRQLAQEAAAAAATSPMPQRTRRPADLFSPDQYCEVSTNDPRGRLVNKKQHPPSCRADSEFTGAAASDATAAASAAAAANSEPAAALAEADADGPGLLLEAAAHAELLPHPCCAALLERALAAEQQLESERTRAEQAERCLLAVEQNVLMLQQQVYQMEERHMRVT